ncbi:SUMO ligase siz1 [Mortierella alpina]|nr:SUMO ligase siz1 [Mortierella alpina]
MSKDPEFQVMVFCGWADGPSSSQTLMEFPHVCEIKVNGKVLEANLRGMKNKPGTVSPANITKLCKLEPADYNKVEFIYANSTKRYYASMHLVKKISVESIVAEIERGKFLSKEKMLRLIEDRNKDDDIMATSSTLSLKCPCFDAYTFFNLNEQTPTWTCPVCSRIMHSWEEIVVDGYFKDILKLTPKSLENITVQADGTWELPSVTPPSDQPAAPSPKKQKSTPAGGESVFVIDEEESGDEGSPTPAPAGKPSKPAVEVIDLISDSEDEVDEGNLPAQTVTDEDGDTSMQEAANSLQSMATATGEAAPRSVKTEDLEKSVPVDGTDGEAPPPSTSTGVAPTAGGTATAAAAPEIHSIVGSASGSPPTAPSSASPEISSRMAQTDPNQSGLRSPTSRVPQTVWRDSSEDMFMNALLNPRRKRQFDDTVDTESINAMSYDARQRIARLDIHSNGSSDRGSSSTIPSPDAVRRSTSSPTPVPSFHELDRRGYYENGNGHPMSVAPPIHGTFAPQQHPPHQSHVSHGSSQRGDSRGATMSPPLHPGYNSASPHHPHHHSHHSHHHPHHRSANSPGPEYYSGLSRPSSTGSLSAVASMAHRPSSIPVSSLSRPASSSSSSMTAMPAYGSSSSNSGWSPNEWRSDLRSYMRSGSSNPASHGDSSPRRISTDEAGSSLGHQASFTKYPPSQQQHSPPPFHQSQSSYAQSTPQHQRHYSNDDSSFYGRRDGHSSNSNSNSNGNGNGSVSGAFHRVDYINNSDEGRGSSSSSSYHHDHGSHSQHAQQHVYSSNHGSRSSSYSSSVANGHEGGAGVSEDRRRSESSKDEEAPIFSHGIRGARAR